MKRGLKMASGALFAAMALGVVPAGLMPANWGGEAAAYAQNFGQRVVNGVVESNGGSVLSGATVFLRNNKTKAIRSYTTAADGHFRFAQVNMSEDFELWAEKNGKKSPVKTVSSWDTRKEVSAELRLK